MFWSWSTFVFLTFHIWPHCNLLLPFVSSGLLFNMTCFDILWMPVSVNTSLFYLKVFFFWKISAAHNFELPKMIIQYETFNYFDIREPISLYQTNCRSEYNNILLFSIWQRQSNRDGGIPRRPQSWNLAFGQQKVFTANAKLNRNLWTLQFQL